MQEARSRRKFLAVAGTTATAGLAGCLGLFEPSDYDIGMTAAAFTPETLTVSAGTTVVWQNTSSRGHTVTAYEDTLPEGASFFATGGYETEAEARDAWQSEGDGAIDTNETFEHTFEIPGEYGYVCLPHETGGMIGTIEVTE
ncbi:MAG: cupredoxin domain-containing protein [Halohasta sp.]